MAEIGGRDQCCGQKRATLARSSRCRLAHGAGPQCDEVLLVVGVCDFTAVHLSIAPNDPGHAINESYKPLKLSETENAPESDAAGVLWSSLMEETFAVLAAVVASVFAIDLWWSHRDRPRSHAIAWAVAISSYALATWILALGLTIGWNDTSFRTFFFFGAVANVPLLALGSVYLAFGVRLGNRARNVVLAFLGVGVWIVMTAVPVAEVANVGVPEGSEVFSFLLTKVDGGITLPSPRLFALVGTSIGAVSIMYLAGVSVVRSWRVNRRVAYGSLSVVIGALVPSLGGSLAALGEAAGFAASLLVGVSLLWLGYRVTTMQRSEKESAPSPGLLGR